MGLDDYMASRSESRFAFGSFDCFNFASGAVEAQTGVDLMSKYFGKYGDETSAAAGLWAQFGTLDLREVFLKVVALTGAEISHTPTEGDIACVEWPGRSFRSNQIRQSCGLGVVWRGSVWAATRKGLMLVPAAMPIIDYWSFAKCR